jgi:polyhydroxybutyrate depolymerase
MNTNDDVSRRFEGVGNRSHWIRRGIAFLALMALAVTCSPGSITGPGESGNWKAGTAAHATLVATTNRTFLVHVPPHRRLSGGIPVAYPLVIVLHGSSGDGSSIEVTSKMDSLADAAAFLVAYPNGTGGDFNLYPSDWNSGTCCGGAFRDKVDDIGFITALIKHVSASLPVDSRRIYIAGFSAGGLMAYHAGCQLSTTISAIAVVSGSLVDYSCTPSKTVSLFAVHGTDDPEVPYDVSAPTPANAAPKLAANLPPTLQFWTALNKCSGGAITTPSAHVTRTRFTVCGGAEVDFYAIQGGTHGWPAGPEDPGAQPPMSEVKASILISQFFARHLR